LTAFRASFNRGERSHSIEDVGAFDIVTIPSIDAWHLLGLQAHFLEAVATKECPPILLIYSMPGRLLSLGRYHLYSGPVVRAGLSAYRRFTGGRVVGSGEGWLGVALILPSRTALLPDRDIKLKPDQVMNRYVRGMLAGPRSLGLECFYPGRDAITFERREIAMCTFETNASGAMLFEATLAVNRGMEEVVHDLERFDPDGQLSCAMYGPDTATKLVREMDRDISFAEVAHAIARGYSDLLGGGNNRELSDVEIAQANRRGAALEQRGWLKFTAEGALTSRLASQLGTIEARVKTSADGLVESLALAGDFIASSPGIVEFQSEMRGRRLDLPSVSAAAMKVFGPGDNFILGIGDLSNLVQLVTRAQ
jgi:lipoate-protein ligase A